MNGTIGRRVFVGSLAGAGVGALGATSLLDIPVSAQRASAAPLIREIRRQLKEAFARMRDGRADGARQAATVLRLYASSVNDGDLRAALRRANRRQLLLTDMNHGELVREANELGIDPSRLPPHSLDRVGREAALDRLISEGLSPFMRDVADYVDGVAAKMETLERSGRAKPMQVALRQPIPDPVECGNCDNEKAQLDNALQVATVVCAASMAIPVLAELCAAASLTYVVFQTTYAICLAILQLCSAYYN
jgi:hypothetical protein